jgi:hypothetical protein
MMNKRKINVKMFHMDAELLHDSQKNMARIPWETRITVLARPFSNFPKPNRYWNTSSYTTQTNKTTP